MGFLFSRQALVFLIFGIFLTFIFLDFWFQILFFSKINYTGNSLESVIRQSACIKENTKSLKNLNGSFTRVEKMKRLMNHPLDWVFKDIHGQVIDLYCLKESQFIVLNFWATWCPPCIEELPLLSQLAEKSKNRIFVVAVSTEPLDEIKRFLEQSFPDLSPDLKVARVSLEEKSLYFPEDSLPATYIFNKEGLLKIKHIGVKNWADDRIIKQIMNIP